MSSSTTKKRLFLFLPLVAFMAVAIFFYSALFSDPRELESALVGKPLPAFSLPALMDAQQLSKADMPKTGYLLNVWATWCPTCRAEHEYLNTLAEKGITIVGLNYKDGQADARRWLQGLGDPYVLNLFDSEGELAFDMGVYGAPETYVVSHDGIVLYRHVGNVTAGVWRDLLADKYREAGGVMQ